MVRHSTRKPQRRINACVVLLRSTTWKCGKLERLVVKFLKKQRHTFGRVEIPVREMVQYFNLEGKQKSEFLDAVNRLERRNIIKIRLFKAHHFHELSTLSRQGGL